MRKNTPLVEDVSKLKNIILKMSGPARRVALRNYAAPVKKTDFDRATVVLDLALAAWMASRVVQGFLTDPSNLWLTLAAIPLSLFLADGISQVFHKFLDSYANETHIFWGKAAREFRKHHEDPDNLNHVNYLSHVSAFGRFMAPLFIAFSFIPWANHPAVGFHVVFLLVVLLNATEVHRHAHRRDPHWFAVVLQKLHLTLDQKSHMKHHRPPYDNHYSVISGWTQWLFQKTDFWHKMDRYWWKTFGELPRIWIHDPRAIPADIMEELFQHPEKVPGDLIAYMEVYRERASPEVLKLLKLAQSRELRQ